MAKQTIGIGNAANDGLGEPARNAGAKINDNFTELYERVTTVEQVAGSPEYGNIEGRPTLGTASSRDVGTSPGNVVEVLTGNKLPALDGSNLTNIAGGGGGGSIDTFGVPTAGQYAKWTDSNTLEGDTLTFADVSGLGTAATLNVGTGANQIVQLNGSAQLPAVDGSLLTGIAGGGGGGYTTPEELIADLILGTEAASSPVGTDLFLSLRNNLTLEQTAMNTAAAAVLYETAMLARTLGQRVAFLEAMTGIHSAAASASVDQVLASTGVGTRATSFRTPVPLSPASGAEVNTGTNNDKIITALSLAGSTVIRSKATEVEIIAGTDVNKGIVPKELADALTVATVTSASGLLTLDFSIGLVKYWEPSENTIIQAASWSGLAKNFGTLIVQQPASPFTIGFQTASTIWLLGLPDELNVASSTFIITFLKPATKRYAAFSGLGTELA